MEESSEAHMETDVSSTTEDVLEVQNVSGSHMNIETSVSVEPMDEDMKSPTEQSPVKSNEKPQDSTEPTKSPPTPKLVHLKRIVIKAANKTYHIQKPAVMSPGKPEDISRITKNDSPPTPKQSKDVVDSSSKPGPPKTPEKLTPAISGKGPAMEVHISVEKSPQKEKETVQEPRTDQSKDPKTSPEKEKTRIIILNREKPKATPTKNQSQSVTILDKDKELPEQISQNNIPEEKSSTPKPTGTASENQHQKNTPKESTKPIIIRKDPPSTKPDVNEKTTNKVDDSSVSTCSGVTPILEEASNDSQMETNSESSEKDHNKSISRELRSLIKSAKESKIINECTQLTSKTRKSRTVADSNSSLNIDSTAEKIQVRRSSDNSQVSNSSEKSDKAPAKRSMRSQNLEFVTKVKSFLNSGKGEALEEESEVKTKEANAEFASSIPKKKKENDEHSIMTEAVKKSRSDTYCWRCHWAVEPAASEKIPAPLQCTVCPRSFHFKCISVQERNKINTSKSWVCPECVSVLQAENSETRSPAMKKISLGMLCDLLKYSLDRMKEVNGVEPFLQPVDRSAFPDYDKYVVHPMDLSLMELHIKEGYYGSTEAFLADANWILHNSIIFNTLQSKLTAGARALVRSCRAEMGEIEACPECYAAAHARRPTWFTDVCSTPHVLLWAKLKGFPYWPAKGMSVNSSGLVDVRFFGQHDRAWVPARDCFLYSEKDPNNFRSKRQDLLDSIHEAEQHIRNISRKYGKFVYPAFRTPFDPAKLDEQLKMMIPSFEGEVRSFIKDKPSYSPSTPKVNIRSESKSSKGSHHDEDTSESEDTPASSRRMADSGETPKAAKAEEKQEKDKQMDIDETPSKGKETRKRRRSELEETVATFTDLQATDNKKKRTESSEKPAETAGKSTPNKNIKVIIKETESVKKEANSKTTVKETDSKTTVKDGESKTPAKDANSKTVAKEADSKTLAKDANSKTVAKDATSKTVPKEATPKTVAKEPFKDENKSLKSGEREPTTSTTSDKKANRQPTIRVISIAKILNSAIKPTKEPAKPKATPEKSTPNEKDKGTPQEEKTKAQKRRSSKSNKSLNTSTSKINKTEVATKEAPKDSKTSDKKSEIGKNVVTSDKKSDAGKSLLVVTYEKKSAKERTKDDDVTLAELAKKEGKESKKDANELPTITNVRSLSRAGNSQTTITKTKTAANSFEVTVVNPSQSSVFTPTVTDTRDVWKETIDKLQKLKETEPLVGRVGVRAFARMTSPPKETAPSNEVLVEVKTEPIDFDDADRQSEKMDLMNAITLKPVNPIVNNLREVRINKVVVPAPRKPPPTKPVEIRPKAKKSFPQSKKVDEGRSELTSKNSMVYIPIQPPMSQAPTRGARANGPAATPPLISRANSTITTSTANTMPPLVSKSISMPSPSTTNTVAVPTVGSVPTVGNVPPVGNVPTVGNTVHTVPLITSVNGQWTFSLQPMMSVGSVDNTKSPPMVNGVGERGTVAGQSQGQSVVMSGTPLLTPIVPAAARSNSDNPPREPPRLQQRPSLTHPLDPTAPAGSLPPPSTAGPITAKLNQNAVKLTDFFRTLLEESLERIDEPTAQLTAAKAQLEQLRWRHQQDVEEIRHNHDLTIAEMRASFEKEKARLLAEVRRNSQASIEEAVKLAKSKQWCAMCSQEAQFYCCWNTSYCDYPCQRAHWAQHYAVCAQQRSQDNDGNSNPSENRLQAAPDTLPKTTAAPNLTAGGKLAPSRVYTQEIAPKPSIIMSMVDEGGAQTMKYVGTYKPPTSSPAPLIINKQMLNSEEAAKKVVTSGGYLIVGAANAPNATTTSSVVNSSRRVQYFS